MKEDKDDTQTTWVQKVNEGLCWRRRRNALEKMKECPTFHHF